jgi:glutathione S-transferase
VSLTLVIGNRNYSSWSLRAWLYLTESGLPFEERFITLHVGDWRGEIARYSPAGRVPVLIDDGVTVWDTLAIMCHLLERFPEALGWPADPAARALARSVTAEMHSGFLAVRGELPQNIRRRRATTVSAQCRTQIERIQGIWQDCRERYGERGPWLFGELGIADVMFAPVALRFVSYEIPVAGRASEFVDAILGLPSVQEWILASRAEGLAVDFIDELGSGDMILG